MFFVTIKSCADIIFLPKVPIIFVGDVSAATARITVNYGYDSYS